MIITSLQIILKHIQILFALLEFLVLIINLFFHTFLPQLQISHNQPQVIINRLEMQYLLIHAVQLLLHLSDFLLSWSFIPLQLLNFIIQNVTELLELLLFLFKLIDSFGFLFDGVFSLFYIEEGLFFFFAESVQIIVFGVDGFDYFFYSCVLFFGLLFLLTQQGCFGISCYQWNIKNY